LAWPYLLIDSSIDSSSSWDNGKEEKLWKFEVRRLQLLSRNVWWHHWLRGVTGKGCSTCIANSFKTRSITLRG